MRARNWSWLIHGGAHSRPGAGVMRPVSGVLTAVALAVSFALPDGTSALTITDPTGQPLTLSGPPKRLISLVPSVTETLFALGAEDLLVGVTDFCDFPPAAKRKPRVGSMLDPSLEAVLALRPDLVVATRAGNRQEAFEQLRRLRIPVYVVDPASLADVMELTARLADLVGRRAAGASLVSELQRRVKAVTTQVAGRRRPRVLYVLWPEPLIVPGRGALISDLIAQAGGESVTAERAEAYPRWSIEAAVARGPEVILLARHGTGIAHSIARERWERFAALPAIRSGRIHEVEGDLLHRYSPRVVEGLETLARLIHPEAFARSGAP